MKQNLKNVKFNIVVKQKMENLMDKENYFIFKKEYNFKVILKMEKKMEQDIYLMQIQKLLNVNLKMTF